METTQHLNLFERVNQWVRNSIMIKLLSIGFLVLILLIPTAWIDGLINERQSRAEDVMQEVSEKWSGSQTLSGPILVVPYKVFEKIDHGKDGIEIVEHREKYFFLPETLDIKGDVKTKVLNRGIFDAVVYESSLLVNANFTKPDFKGLDIKDENVLWSDAYTVFSLTDLRGISENPLFVSGKAALPTEPSSNTGVSVKKYLKEYRPFYANRDVALEEPSEFSTNGIVAKMNWTSAEDFQGKTSIKLKLKGSRKLSFVPTGKTTNVKLTSPWTNPSFDGEFLPDSREITSTGFNASWKVLHYNRPFSQQWNNSDEKLTGSEFGVRLLIPVDQYQKSIRTSKYGILIIILTFISLFLVEITKGVRIHPFQYILIGVALIIYYTLLLSFSEQVGYNAAYWIATIATVTLVSFYSISFLKNFRLVTLFTVLLTIFYSFIFIIILQQDFSLLIGSVGLFLIVGALMYFSSKVQWYQGSPQTTVDGPQ